jgi:hypothetical protein
MFGRVRVLQASPQVTKRKLSRTDLDNMLGVAMNLKPDEVPKNETPQQQAERERKTAERNYSYFNQEPVNLARDKIREADKAMGGDGTAPRVTVLPLQVSTPDYGPVQLPLFRVDRVNAKGEVVDSRFVTNNGELFGPDREKGLSSFDNSAEQLLPGSVMTYPAADT